MKINLESIAILLGGQVIPLATEWQQSPGQGVVLIINIACYAEKDVKITFSPDAMRFPPNLPNDWKRV